MNIMTVLASSSLYWRSIYFISKVASRVATSPRIRALKIDENRRISVVINISKVVTGPNSLRPTQSIA